jgi:hypothetical protein
VRAARLFYAGLYHLASPDGFDAKWVCMPIATCFLRADKIHRFDRLKDLKRSASRAANSGMPVNC